MLLRTSLLIVCPCVLGWPVPWIQGNPYVTGSEMKDALKDVTRHLYHNSLEPIVHGIHTMSEHVGHAAGKMAGRVTRSGLHKTQEAAMALGFHKDAQAIQAQQERLVHSVQRSTDHFVSGAVPAAVGLGLGVATANPWIIAASGAGIANAGIQTKLENMVCTRWVFMCSMKRVK
jgi:hypothetical protein